jgi:uncharacterized protein YwgA
MRSRLVVLKLIFNQLGITSDIGDVAKRKIIQKTIYLLQELGGNLNYHYGWYIKGPYSPDLTKDYYELSEIEASDESDWKDKSLKDDAIQIIEKLKPLMKPPYQIECEKDDWLELLASIRFLRKIPGKNDSDVEKLIKERKNHLWKYYHQAVEALKALN